MTDIRVVFLGTSEFAVPILRLLVERRYAVAGVVTQPDRPKGRKRELTPPPVKTEAVRLGLPVLQPPRLKAEEALEDVFRLKPDLIVTAAYGQIVPKALLDAPPLGCLNVHASLLPKYRGGAPIQRAIMNGESVTGVTIMRMVERLDAGDIVSQVEVPIGEDDTAGTMTEKLARAGAELLGTTLPDWIAGRIRPVPQREEEATYAPNLTRADEIIRWERPARDLSCQVRGLHPSPGAYTLYNGDVLKVWACIPLDDVESAAEAEPGTVVRVGGEGVDVRCGRGVLRLTQLQPAGKRPMAAADFVRGGRMLLGTVLGA